MESHTPASDVYALGILLWEVLSSKFAYTEGDYTDMWRDVRNTRIRADVRAMKRPDLEAAPEEVRDIIAAAWAHEREERPTCAEILLVLNEWWTAAK
jgi:hypothetical protein